MINVTTPSSGFSGPQLIGDIHPVNELESATTGAILDRFTWNGSGDLGEIPAAEWCSNEGRGGSFCKSFQADVCPAAVLQEAPVKRFCAKASDPA
ncbi:hypothetical protein ACFPIF_09845 [Brevundimonas faecalis]|uniref:hypothetical protein n=1 Tax=Brevundimonas faecalis TaxID=947378 RepID=UPI00361CE616